MVLLDVSMPALDGSELIAIMRKHPALRGLRILLYSNRSAEELRRLAEECGASGFVTKSPDYAELLRAVAAG